nr:hypothetical protein Iba_chr11bCG16500 [Ipomoea batatas]
MDAGDDDGAADSRAEGRMASAMRRRTGADNRRSETNMVARKKRVFIHLKTLQFLLSSLENAIFIFLIIGFRFSNGDFI